MTLPRELMSRTAALAALAVAVLGSIGILGVLLGFIFAGEREDVADNLRQLAAYRSEIDASGQTKRAYDELRARVGAMPGLIHADAGAPAAAQVQTALKDIVQGSGGELRSAQVLPSVIANGFEIVSVDCDLTIPASRLRDVVYAIETHRPYLFVQNADITAPVGFDAKSGAEPSYDVRWTLRAYRWVDSR
jgi:hypothetical protein